MIGDLFNPDHNVARFPADAGTIETLKFYYSDPSIFPPGARGELRADLKGRGPYDCLLDISRSQQLPPPVYYVDVTPALIWLPHARASHNASASLSVSGPDPASKDYIYRSRTVTTSKTSILQPCPPFNTSMRTAVRNIHKSSVGAHHLFNFRRPGMSILDLGADLHNLDLKWISPCHESAGSHLFEWSSSN